MSGKCVPSFDGDLVAKLLEAIETGGAVPAEIREAAERVRGSQAVAWQFTNPLEFGGVEVTTKNDASPRYAEGSNDGKTWTEIPRRRPFLTPSER